MSTLGISHPSKIVEGACTITGSKSESNRLLILGALFPNLKLENLSNSDDTQAMQRGLSSTDDTIDIGHAGTTMRFLTSYFATTPGVSKVLTGSKRMQERPIKILVNALRSIGADIEYVKHEGYPPLRIQGKKLKGGAVHLPADVSSQYISALLLLGPVLEQGVELYLEGKITSVPYIKMTLALLNNFGASTAFQGQHIRVEHQSQPKKTLQVVESDWSSASYFLVLQPFLRRRQFTWKVINRKVSKAIPYCDPSTKSSE